MRILLLLAIVTLSNLPVCAEDDISSFTGYLVDRGSLLRTNQQINMDLTLAAYHWKNASQCRTGYGLISNGQVFYLDAHGNRLAKSLIASTPSNHALMIMIRGKIVGGKILVKQLSDISMQKF